MIFKGFLILYLKKERILSQIQKRSTDSQVYLLSRRAKTQPVLSKQAKTTEVKVLQHRHVFLSLRVTSD